MAALAISRALFSVRVILASGCRCKASSWGPQTMQSRSCCQPFHLPKSVAQQAMRRIVQGHLYKEHTGVAMRHMTQVRVALWGGAPLLQLQRTHCRAKRQEPNANNRLFIVADWSPSEEVTEFLPLRVSSCLSFVMMRLMVVAYKWKWTSDLPSRSSTRV